MGSLSTDTSALQALGLTSGGVALSYAVGAETADGDGGGRQHGVHVHAERDDGSVDVHAGRPARPSADGAATTRTT